MTSAPSHILIWPADRFYWATLPPGIIRRDGVLSAGAIECGKVEARVLRGLSQVVVDVSRCRGTPSLALGARGSAIVRG